MEPAKRVQATCRPTAPTSSSPTMTQSATRCALSALMVIQGKVIARRPS
jgi:hypothetical protein